MKEIAFDPSFYPVSLNLPLLQRGADVQLCLRVLDTSVHVVYTPNSSTTEVMAKRVPNQKLKLLDDYIHPLLKPFIPPREIRGLNRLPGGVGLRQLRFGLTNDLVLDIPIGMP